MDARQSTDDHNRRRVRTDRIFGKGIRVNRHFQCRFSILISSCNLFARLVSQSIERQKAKPMIYTTLLLIGLLGLFAQAVLGISHSGHAGHGGHTGHGGHRAAPGGRGERGPSPLWTLLSPLAIFSLCLGAGATGLLLRPAHLAAATVALAAVLGGLVFFGLLVRPLWNLLFKFASKPSAALEGMVASQAEAVTGFDGRGRGLVGLTIDGQWVRVLATLEADDQIDAPAVKPGERLTVISVDGRANTCRVARL